MRRCKSVRSPVKCLLRLDANRDGQRPRMVSQANKWKGSKVEGKKALYRWFSSLVNQKFLELEKKDWFSLIPKDCLICLNRRCHEDELSLLGIAC